MIRVLVVEDTEVNRLVLSGRLSKMGYEVLVAANGREGLEMANRELPDIILMDMYLPEIDGTELTRTLKQQASTSQIPIIALTAHSVSKSRDDILELGCDEYELKPINFDTLTKKIQDLVGDR